MQRFKRKMATVLALVMLVSTFAAQNVGAVSFTDVPAGHWAQAYIEAMADKGVINGMGDGTFNPEGYVTRAQFAAMINRALGLTTVAQVANFTDLPTAEWARTAILIAAGEGYMQGDGTRMRPDDNITRQEASTMVYRAARFSAVDNSISFTDVGDIAVWAEPAVKTLAANGILVGMDDGSFAPEANMSRAQAATVVFRTLNLRNQEIPDDAEIVQGTSYGNPDELTIVEGTLAIVNRDTVITNVQIEGDLIIAESVGDGDVTLQGVKVLGNTYVRGGGSNSVEFIDCDMVKIYISYENGQVRVVVNGGSVVDVVFTAGGKLEITGEGFVESVLLDEILGAADSVVLEGNIDKVVVEADVELSIAGNVGEIELNSAANLKLESGAEVGALLVKEGAAGAKVDIPEDAVVKEAVVDAAVDFSGKGTPESAQINVSGVTSATDMNTTEGSAEVGAPPANSGGPVSPNPTTPEEPKIAINALDGSPWVIVTGTSDVTTPNAAYFNITARSLTYFKDGTRTAITLNWGNSENRNFMNIINELQVGDKFSVLGGELNSITATAGNGFNIAGTTLTNVTAGIASGGGITGGVVLGDLSGNTKVVIGTMNGLLTVGAIAANSTLTVGDGYGAAGVSISTGAIGIRIGTIGTSVAIGTAGAVNLGSFATSLKINEAANSVTVGGGTGNVIITKAGAGVQFTGNVDGDVKIASAESANLRNVGYLLISDVGLSGVVTVGAVTTSDAKIVTAGTITITGEVHRNVNISSANSLTLGVVNGTVTLDANGGVGMLTLNGSAKVTGEVTNAAIVTVSSSARNVVSLSSLKWKGAPAGNVFVYGGNQVHLSSAGNLYVDNNFGTTFLSPGTLTFVTGSITVSRGTLQLTDNWQVGVGQKLTVVEPGVVIVSGGDAEINFTATGSGNLEISGGTLKVTNGGKINTSSAAVRVTRGTLEVATGTLKIGNPDSAHGANAIITGGKLTVSGDGAEVAVSGGALTMSGVEIVVKNDGLFETGSKQAVNVYIEEGDISVLSGTLAVSGNALTMSGVNVIVNDKGTFKIGEEKNTEAYISGGSISIPSGTFLASGGSTTFRSLSITVTTPSDLTISGAATKFIANDNTTSNAVKIVVSGSLTLGTIVAGTPASGSAIMRLMSGAFVDAEANNFATAASNDGNTINNGAQGNVLDGNAQAFPAGLYILSGASFGSINITSLSNLGMQSVLTAAPASFKLFAANFLTFPAVEAQVPLAETSSANKYYKQNGVAALTKAAPYGIR